MFFYKEYSIKEFWISIEGFNLKEADIGIKFTYRLSEYRYFSINFYLGPINIGMGYNSLSQHLNRNL